MDVLYYILYNSQCSPKPGWRTQRKSWRFRGDLIDIFPATCRSAVTLSLSPSRKQATISININIKENIIRERAPLENIMMFVVERIWRSFVFCGWRVHFEGSIVALFGRSREGGYQVDTARNGAGRLVDHANRQGCCSYSWPRRCLFAGVSCVLSCVLYGSATVHALGSVL